MPWFFWNLLLILSRLILCREEEGGTGERLLVYRELSPLARPLLSSMHYLPLIRGIVAALVAAHSHVLARVGSDFETQAPLCPWLMGRGCNHGERRRCWEVDLSRR
jgi:hypothetical protein